jgi:outer membrane protein assembly factor BamD
VSAMTALSRSLRIAATGAMLVLSGLTLAGCSGLFGSSQVETLPDEPADRTYNEGLALQQQKNWRRAALKFALVEKSYPYSDWGKRSMLMAAYSFYEGGDYQETVNFAQRYLQQYPSSSDAPYAQYLLGSSYYEQIPDSQRDQKNTERALIVLDEIPRKWPNSEYALSARRKAEVAKDNLAAREMNVGRFYLNQRNYASAINRFRIVVANFQTTRHVEEALARLAEAYLALGVESEAQTAAAILGHNFPDSQWYKDTYALIASKGLEPRENSASWMSRAWKSIAG